MLKFHLQQAIKTIDNLVYLTKQDVQDIGNIPKQDIFKNVHIKKRLLDKFDSLKSKIDLEISSLNAKNNKIALQDILSDEEKLSLGLLEDKMLILKKTNKEYIKLVVSVSSVYLSLINRLIPNEMDGYNRVGSKSSFLNLTV